MKLLLCFFSVLMVLTAPVRAEDSVGQITASKGAVNLFQTGRSAATPASKGTVLFRGDEIETGKDSYVTVTMTDGAVLTMGANGTVVVDDYLFDETKPAKSKAHIKLLRAAFSYVGGKVDVAPGQGTRMKKRSMAPETPAAWTAEDVAWIRAELPPEAP